MRIKAVAILCYMLALGGAAAFAWRVLALGVGLEWEPFALPPPWPWLEDLAWLLVFSLQHSVMARQGFKSRWTRFVPAALERSLYAALSGLIVLGMALTWQRLDGPEWWALPLPFVLLPLLAGAGLALINARFDHAGLFGLRQAWVGAQPSPPETLLIVGPYRFIRHPLMACLLVFLWAQPVMTPTLAVLVGGLTVYIVLGILLEERDLRRRFPGDYEAYRRRVPALVPWRWPAKSAE